MHRRGAQCHTERGIYVSLKRRYNHNFSNNGRIYLPQRQAVAETGSGFEEIVRWFLELQHYGFIVQTRPGYLGLDGKGKAPHWRLTGGLCYMHDEPTRDFLLWDGVRFSRHRAGGDDKPKTESRCGKPEALRCGKPEQLPLRKTGAQTGTSAAENRSIERSRPLRENRSINSLPLGRGGRALPERVAQAPARTPRPTSPATRITDYGRSLNGRRAAPVDPWDGLDIPPYLLRQRPGPAAPSPKGDDGDFT